MEAKAVARRLDEIHNDAISGNPEGALSELRRLRSKVEEENLKTENSSQILERTNEMEMYIFMSSGEYTGSLIEALIRMVEGVETTEDRKVQTISLGLRHLLRENGSRGK